MATPARNLYGTRGSPARRYVRAVALILGVLVLCIWAGRALTDRFRDWTPEELRERMAEAARASPEAALETLPLERAIAQVNRMAPEARREVMRSDAARDYLMRLKPEQRRRFVLETVDRGIQQQIERYRKLSPEERKAFVEDARKQQQEARDKMDQLPADKKKEVRDMTNSDKIAEALEQASKAFLTLTTSEERAELQPLYDGALDNLQHAQNLK